MYIIYVYYTYYVTKKSVRRTVYYIISVYCMYIHNKNNTLYTNRYTYTNHIYAHMSICIQVPKTGEIPEFSEKTGSALDKSEWLNILQTYIDNPLLIKSILPLLSISILLILFDVFTNDVQATNAITGTADVYTTATATAGNI